MDVTEREAGVTMKMQEVEAAMVTHSEQLTVRSGAYLNTSGLQISKAAKGCQQKPSHGQNCYGPHMGRST